MAKIADLLVQLTVETASFRRDLNTARSQVKEFGEGLTGTFSQLQRIASTGLQAFGVAMAVDFVKSTNEGIDALGKLSQKIGISVEDLSTLSHAAALANVPIETFANGIGLLSKAMAGVTNDENKGASAALQNIGVKARDANGALRPTKDVLADIANAFAGMEDGAQKTALAIQLFGRSGKELIPLLNSGSSGLKEMQDEAQKLGLVLDEKTAKAAERFNDNLTRLQGASKGLAQTLITELLPSLNRISDGLVEAAKSGDRFSSIQAIGKTLDFTLATLSTIVSVLRIAIDYVGKFFGAIGAAAQLIAKGDFAGLRELDTRLKKELPDPFRDAATEIQGIWGVAMGGIQDTTESAVTLVDKRINAVLFGIRSAKSQLANGLSGNKEQNDIKAARDEYANTINQLTELWAQSANRRGEIEQAALLASQIRDAKIAEATKASTDKRIADAKRYAEELMRANATLDDMSAKLRGELDPFDKIQQEYGQAIDKLTAIWNKYPETRARIEDLILSAVKARDKAILDEEQKTLEESQKLIAEHIKAGGAQLENVPIITSNQQPTLVGNDFYTNFIRNLTANKKNLQKELDDLLGVKQFKSSIDEIILEEGKAVGGIGVFFRQYADYATNAAKVVHDAFAKVFGALEDQLTNLLAHFKFDFNSLLDTIKESIARAVVQKFILGPIAKGLGNLLGLDLQKADGSKDNPFHVVVENGGLGIPGVGGSGSDGGDSTDPTGGLLGKLQGSFSKIFSSIGGFFSSIGSALGSVLKSVIGSIGAFLGGAFADGGDPPLGKLSLVGERGPELFVPRQLGTIIPNHAFSLGGRGNVTNIINLNIAPTKSDPFGYSPSQLANASFNGLARATGRS